MVDYAFWTLAVTVGTLLATILLRKRILAALGRLLFTGAIEFARDEFFEETSETTEGGEKRVLARPNAKLGALMSRYGPGMAAFAMDWARKNVKIKLPPFELPAGTDLKQVGMSVLAQKALSGKKLKLDDAVPLIMGYAKDFFGPIIEGFSGKTAAKKETESVVPLGKVTR